jgi:hypothetical protein
VEQPSTMSKAVAALLGRHDSAILEALHEVHDHVEAKHARIKTEDGVLPAVSSNVHVAVLEEILQVLEKLAEVMEGKKTLQ